jgi:hypothetical protein
MGIANAGLLVWSVVVRIKAPGLMIKKVQKAADVSEPA